MKLFGKAQVDVNLSLGQFVKVITLITVSSPSKAISTPYRIVYRAHMKNSSAWCEQKWSKTGTNGF